MDIGDPIYCAGIESWSWEDSRPWLLRAEGPRRAHRVDGRRQGPSSCARPTAAAAVPTFASRVGGGCFASRRRFSRDASVRRSQNSIVECAILLGGRWSNWKAADGLASRRDLLDSRSKIIVLRIPGTKATRAAYQRVRAAEWLPISIGRYFQEAL